jgi:hypothetical protein
VRSIFTVAFLAALAAGARAHVQLEATLDVLQEIPPPTIEFTVSLDSAQEVPAPTVAEPLPTGTATLTLNLPERTLTYELTVENLSGAPVAAHIHDGNVGVAGPIAITLDHAALSGTTVALTDVQLQRLLAGGLYVNVHTAANASGEIRGQIPPGPSGTATFTLEEDGRITYAVTVQNLTGNVNAAHLHRAPPGESGDVEVPLDNSLSGTSTNPLSEDVITALFDGGLYVNVHTNRNQAGEIRGQVRLSKTDSTCFCQTAASPKDFKRCVKQRIQAAGPAGREELRDLKKTFKKGSCGKTKGPKKAIACCLPQTPDENIVVGRLCAPVKAKKCTKLGGINLGDGSSCFPTNPCQPPASASGAFL